MKWMSGGSYNYICYTIENELYKRMHDVELDDLIKDIAELTHDLEWWVSGDTCEETYRKSVDRFKKKWFCGNRKERLKGYIDKEIERTKTELYQMLGVQG